MPQQPVGSFVGVNGTKVSGAKHNPELAQKTSQLLLSETKATLPANAQNHVKARSVDSAERARQIQQTMKNLYGKKSHE